MSETEQKYPQLAEQILFDETEMDYAKFVASAGDKYLGALVLDEYAQLVRAQALVEEKTTQVARTMSLFQTSYKAGRHEPDGAAMRTSMWQLTEASASFEGKSQMFRRIAGMYKQRADNAKGENQ